jgi:alpha-beta hydrolase superfamily lysophospholipase
MYKIALTLSVAALIFLNAQMATAQVAEVPWSSLPDFECESNDPSCFTRAKKLIADAGRAFPYSEGQQRSYDIYNYRAEKDRVGVHRFFIDKQPTEHVYLIIHGLYGDELQFRGLAYHLNSRGQNVLSLVLPGHGTDWRRGPKISFADWTSEVAKAVKLAKHLGRKLIVFGQSTGGLLAALEAIERPDNISALMLMEPAFRVQPKMQSMACGMKFFVNHAHESTFLAKMAGIDPKNIPKSVSPHMGCVISNARSKILANANLPSENRISSFEDTGANTVIDTTLNSIKLVDSINIPTLILNHGNDEVVGGDDNKAIAGSLSSRGLGTYFEYNSKNYNHGVYNFYEPDVFLKTIDEFLREKMDLKLIEQRADARKRLMRRLSFAQDYLEFYRQAIILSGTRNFQDKVESRNGIFSAKLELSSMAFNVRLGLISKNIRESEVSPLIVGESLAALLDSDDQRWKKIETSIHPLLSPFYNERSGQNVSDQALLRLVKLGVHHKVELIEIITSLMADLRSVLN